MRQPAPALASEPSAVMLGAALPALQLRAVHTSGLSLLAHDSPLTTEQQVMVSKICATPAREPPPPPRHNPRREPQWAGGVRDSACRACRACRGQRGQRGQTTSDVITQAHSRGGSGEPANRRKRARPHCELGRRGQEVFSSQYPLTAGTLPASCALVQEAGVG